jgi:Ca2+-binding EF-hand superfamily protein
MPVDTTGLEQWEIVQIKTFTKWCNNHIEKRWGGEDVIDNILNDWETGVPLMRLAVALYEKNEKNPEYEINFPKLRANELTPKSRIAMVNNGSKALELLAKANCKLRVSGENLVDHDKVQIMGMVWMMILDYAARGFGGSSAEVKRALLEWCNKNTKGYKVVNEGGSDIKNFTKNWRNGLAWCALIHKHKPDVIDYEACVNDTNANNLEKAFALAEEHWDIPRLLDVGDVDVEKPDEKSVMTYVMEYFLAMAGDGLKDAAAAQAAAWLKFLRELRNRMNEYERRARLLLAWCAETTEGWAAHGQAGSADDAVASFNALRDYVGIQKPKNEMEKMDLEALFAEIQTQLLVNNLAPYKPPAELEPDKLQDAFNQLSTSQNAQGAKVRDDKFRFIEKKENVTDEQTLKEIKASFDHYDENKNGSMNFVEFNAACMEMGIALKTQEEKDNLFRQVGGGDDISFDEYFKWMENRMKVTMDDPESAKAAFAAISGGPTITKAQLATDPLTDEDRAFLLENMEEKDGALDYASFIDRVMIGGEGLSSN